uniref:MARVEL domain-containing protein n=1 Tax=Ciona savignyi TaxID=51511 RepID=H2ZM88_CIOSA
MARSSVGIDGGLLKSRDGIFKALVVILSLIAWILNLSSNYWIWHTPRTSELVFVSFALGFTFVTELFSYVVYFFQLYSLPLVRRAPWKILELLYAVICAVFNFVGMCIAAALSGRFTAFNIPNLHGLTVATAICSAALVLLFLLYGFLLLRGQEPRSVPPSRSETHVST